MHGLPKGGLGGGFPGLPGMPGSGGGLPSDIAKLLNKKK